MIDEKKIVNAARNEMPSFLYVRRQDLNFIKGFKAGINWFLDNLWHDASEVPEAKAILIEYKDGYHFTADEDSVEIISLDMGDIARWLYIEDLMKGGK